MNGYDVASEIRGVVSSLQRSNPDLSAGARVKRAWNASVDSRVRDHVTAVFVVPNTQASEVIVYVDSSIWATELSMQTELLRLNLNMELNRDDSASAPRNAEQVEKLTFKVSKDKYISRERRLSTYEQLQEEEREMKQAQPAALSEDELSSLQQAVSTIDNDNLRDIAYEAAKSNLEWRKGIERLRA